MLLASKIMENTPYRRWLRLIASCFTEDLSFKTRFFAYQRAADRTNAYYPASSQCQVSFRRIRGEILKFACRFVRCIKLLLQMVGCKKREKAEFLLFKHQSQLQLYVTAWEITCTKWLQNLRGFWYEITTYQNDLVDNILIVALQ